MREKPHFQIPFSYSKYHNIAVFYVKLYKKKLQIYLYILYFFSDFIWWQAMINQYKALRQICSDSKVWHFVYLAYQILNNQNSTLFEFSNYSTTLYFYQGVRLSHSSSAVVFFSQFICFHCSSTYHMIIVSAICPPHTGRIWHPIE